MLIYLQILWLHECRLQCFKCQLAAYSWRPNVLWGPYITTQLCVLMVTSSWPINVSRAMWGWRRMWATYSMLLKHQCPGCQFQRKKKLARKSAWVHAVFHAGFHAKITMRKFEEMSCHVIESYWNLKLVFVLVFKPKFFLRNWHPGFCEADWGHC